MMHSPRPHHKAPRQVNRKSDLLCSDLRFAHTSHDEVYARAGVDPAHISDPRTDSCDPSALSRCDTFGRITLLVCYERGDALQSSHAVLCPQYGTASLDMLHMPAVGSLFWLR